MAMVIGEAVSACPVCPRVALLITPSVMSLTAPTVQACKAAVPVRLPGKLGDR